MLWPYLPMVIAVVEPVDAPAARLVANLVDLDIADIAVGMELDVVWEDVEPGVTVYRFRPATGGET
jgi:uncharacterized protein